MTMRTRTLAVLGLSSVLALGACSDRSDPAGPAGAAPTVTLGLSGGTTVARPEAWQGLSAPVAAATLGATVYTFDDLSLACDWNVVLPATYRDLVFVDTAYLAACSEPVSGVGISLLPSWDYMYGQPRETRILLAAPADSVSLDVLGFDFFDEFGDATLIVYDEAGQALASASADPFMEWGTVTATAPAGTAIWQIGLDLPQGVVYVDNLAIAYVVDPTTRDDCKDGGWRQYGFANQGQCVAFVETGRDLR